MSHLLTYISILCSHYYQNSLVITLYLYLW